MAKRKSSSFIILLVAAAIFIFYDAVYLVDQTEKAIILQFGRPVGTNAIEPGLHFKLPFIQKVVNLDMRLLDYETPQSELLTRDQKTLVVDAFMRWKIINPLLFYQSFTATTPRSNINAEARQRLGGIVSGELRRELGLHVMADIIFTKRTGIMNAVTDLSNKKAHEWGVEIVDVRIKRADLPVENQKAVYARMATERAQEAQLYRSQGKEENQKIRAEADFKKAKVLAEAQNRSLVIRGEADATAAKVYSEAYNQDLDFYNFIRSLESYQTSFSSKTTLILSPENNEYLKNLGLAETIPTAP